jgi:hypothetical protein
MQTSSRPLKQRHTSDTFPCVWSHRRQLRGGGSAASRTRPACSGCFHQQQQQQPPPPPHDWDCRRSWLRQDHTGAAGGRAHQHYGGAAWQRPPCCGGPYGWVPLLQVAAGPDAPSGGKHLVQQHTRRQGSPCAISAPTSSLQLVADRLVCIVCTAASGGASRPVTQLQTCLCRTGAAVHC